MTDDLKTVIGEAVGRLRALVAQLKSLTEDQSRWSANNLPFTFVRLCAGIEELDALLSAPVVNPPSLVADDPVAAALLNAMAQDVLLGEE